MDTVRGGAVLGFTVWGPVAVGYVWWGGHILAGVTELYYRSDGSRIWGEGGSSWGLRDEVPQKLKRFH